MAVTGKASLSFYVVALLAQGATTATSLTVQQHAYHDTDHKVSSASAHTQGLTPSDVTVGGLPAWAPTEVVEATDGAQYHTDRTYAFPRHPGSGLDRVNVDQNAAFVFWRLDAHNHGARHLHYLCCSVDFNGYSGCRVQ
jgi:hypothetical protein